MYNHEPSNLVEGISASQVIMMIDFRILLPIQFSENAEARHSFPMRRVLLTPQLRSSFRLTPVRFHWHGHSHGNGCCHDDGIAGSEGTRLSESEVETLRSDCRRVTVVGGVVNLAMAGAKVGLGSSGGSYALLADGLHSLVDFGSDLVSYVAVRLTSVSFPRCRFPFGVGRVETTGAVIVSWILLVGGVMLTVSSARQLWNFFCGSGSEVVHGHSHTGADHGHSHFDLLEVNESNGDRTIIWEMVAVAVVSLIAKEWLFRWTVSVGTRAHSRVVIANAYHHRADAWSSGVALVGVGGQLVGLPAVDALAGLVVSGSITKIGVQLLKTSVLEFFDFQSAQELHSLRKALRPVQEDLSLPAVNIFAARHGNAHILHLTVVVRSTSSAADINQSVKLVVEAANKVVRISEHYLNLIFVPDAVSDEQPAESRLEFLREALKEVENFHGIAITLERIQNSSDVEKTSQIHVSIRSTGLNQTHIPSDCLLDVQLLAKAFGVKIVPA